MPRTRGVLPAKVDVAHLIGAGVLASVCPRALIEEVLADTGKASTSGLTSRTRPRSVELHARGARDQAQDAATCGCSPPERLTAWRDALLEEIARGRCVSSCGRFDPRGVRRKMSNFDVRHRGELLHQKHQSTPALRI